MINVVLHIIIRALSETKLDRAKLETAEGARLIAELQGAIAGYRELISILAAEFHLTQAAIDDTGDTPIVYPDLEDEAIYTLNGLVLELKASEEWSRVLCRISEAIENMKTFLLKSAGSTHDLFFTQSRHQALESSESVFNAISQQFEWREIRAKEKKENPEFNFNDTEGTPVDVEPRGLPAPEQGLLEDCQEEDEEAEDGEEEAENEDGPDEIEPNLPPEEEETQERVANE